MQILNTIFAVTGAFVWTGLVALGLLVVLGKLMSGTSKPSPSSTHEAPDFIETVAEPETERDTSATGFWVAPGTHTQPVYGLPSVEPTRLIRTQASLRRGRLTSVSAYTEWLDSQPLRANGAIADDMTTGKLVYMADRRNGHGEGA